MLSAEFIKDYELSALFEKFPRFNDKTSDKWRLVFLIQLKECNLPDDKKLEKLQEIYSDFDYPEDMEDCSIYSKSKISPIMTMDEVIAMLKQKLDIK